MFGGVGRALGGGGTGSGLRGGSVAVWVAEGERAGRRAKLTKS